MTRGFSGRGDAPEPRGPIRRDVAGAAAAPTGAAGGAPAPETRNDAPALLTDPALYDAGAALVLRRPDQALLALAAAFFGRAGNPLAGPEALEAARRDFADLFFSPASGRFLPPCEGAFLEGRMGGQACALAARAYKAAGFEPCALDADPLWRERLTPDHLGVELAFVSALLRNHASAPDKGFDRMARDFHAARLAPWLGAYARALSQAAQSPLYTLAARLLSALA